MLPKFRAVDIETGKLVYGYYIQHQEKTLNPIYTDNDTRLRDKEANTKHYIVYDGGSDWNMPKPLVQVDIDPLTISQFSGWHDSEGTEVFGGDYIGNYVVMWNQLMGGYYMYNLDRVTPVKPAGEFDFMKYKVKGNIWEAENV